MRRPRRSIITCAIFSAALGAALSFAPLFDVLGYESSAAAGIAFGIAAGVFVLARWRDQETAASAREARFAARLTRDALMASAALGLPALALLWLNALRVPNCDPWIGLAFWGLITLPSIWIGSAAAALSAAVCRQTARRAALFALIILANAASLLWHLWAEPPINGHQWLIGYVSGSLYDEAIRVPMSLAYYRAQNAALWCALVWLTQAAYERRWRGRAAQAGAALLALWAGSCAIEESFGVRIDRETIARALGGRIETEHFVIHYPARGPMAELAPWIAEDHEFRYAEMASFFQTDPAQGGKIHSFVYADRESKGELMGARRTLIAKVWLREIHILWRHYGDHLLAHELAHVFTEPIGRGPLRLSATVAGLGVNMGLVEGVATAADWPARELSGHEASAAMRRLEIAPEIRGLVGASGFWAQPSGLAYTLMGSFVRFLIESRGIERFKRAYAAGDLEGAYGVSPDELVARWETFLDTIELTPAQLEFARYRYERPSIFKKVCARAIAELERKSALAAAAHDPIGAERFARRVFELDPSNPVLGLKLARALLAAERSGAALEVLTSLERDRLAPALAAASAQMEADIRWERGEIARARELYGSCLGAGIPDADRRLVLAKRAALEPERRPVRALARAYLIGRPAPGAALYYPMRWLERAPADPLASYILGRKLWQQRLYDESIAPLRAARSALDVDLLREEASLMLGSALYYVGRWDEAGAVFAELGASDWSRLSTLARTWSARVAWARRNSAALAPR